MAVSPVPHKYGPLVLPSVRVDGVADSAVNDLGKKFVFTEGFPWRGGIPLHQDRDNIPVCWTAQQAQLSWSDFDASVDEYFHFGDGLLDTTPRWGAQGSLIRRPKAIIFRQTVGSGHPTTPARVACQQLSSQLQDARVFCGSVRNPLATRFYSLVRFGLLWNEYQHFVIGGEDYYALRIDEQQSVGGDVLFFIEDIALGSDGESPYYGPFNDGPLDALYNADVNTMRLQQPRFGKVRYVYLYGGASALDVDSNGAARRAKIASFVAACPDNMIKTYEFDLTITTENGSSGAKLSDAADVAAREIKQFFQLPA